MFSRLTATVPVSTFLQSYLILRCPSQEIERGFFVQSHATLCPFNSPEFELNNRLHLMSQVVDTSLYSAIKLFFKFTHFINVSN